MRQVANEELCRLCNQTLVDPPESHIVPRFIVRRLVDEKGQFHVLRDRKIEIQHVVTSKHINNVKEAYFLCEDCEGRFQRYERYASNILYAKEIRTESKRLVGRSIMIRDIHTGEINPGWEIGNVDFTQFRLFQLSVLWRVAISTLPFCVDFDIGPKHEMALSAALSQEIPNAREYPCAIFHLTYKSRDIHGIIGVDHRRIRGHWCCDVYLDFLWFRYFISTHKIPKVFQDMFLNTENRMRILHLDVMKSPFVSDWVRSYASQD